MKLFVKSLLVTVLILSMSANTVGAANKFPDVPANHKSAEAINFLAEHEIFKGFPNGNFRPDRHVTRAEASRVIYNASRHLDIKYPLPAGKKERTIRKRDRTTGEIKRITLAERYPNQLIIDGRPPLLMHPGKMVTNAQMTGMVSKAFKVPKASTKLTFNDVAANNWYTQHLRNLVGAGIISNGGTRFNPNKALTRAEVADYVYEAMLYTMNKEPDFDTPIDDGGETMKP